MKPKQALKILDAVSQHPNLALNRAAHMQVVQALGVLQEAIKPKKKPVKKKKKK